MSGRLWPEVGGGIHACAAPVAATVQENSPRFRYKHKHFLLHPPRCLATATPADDAAPDPVLQQLALVHEALQCESTIEEMRQTELAPELWNLLRTWLEQQDPTAPTETFNLHGSDVIAFNEMHVTGIALCHLLYETMPRFLRDVDWKNELDTFYPLLVLSDRAPESMLCRDVVDSVAALQAQFTQIVQFHPSIGFRAAFDVGRFGCALLRRIGYFVSHEQAADTSLLTHDSGLLSSVTRTTDGEWTCIEEHTLVSCLDALHIILNLADILIRAEFLQAPAHPDPALDVFSHHREASLDDFYTHSMLADLRPGQIVQYKHRFKHLFHSISQVVYYHTPSYIRLVQAPLADLTLPDAAHVNLLPLLLQIHPEIPTITETTISSLSSAAHASPFRWLHVSGFVCLVHRDRRSFCASDLRTLLTHALQARS